MDIDAPRAFPTPQGQIEKGLTKREYFAAKAMQGFIAAHSGPEVKMPESKYVARECVEYADALIAALNEKGQP